MSNVKKTLVSDQGDLKPGDRVRVEFEGVVRNTKGSEFSDYGGLVINHGEQSFYSEVFLGTDDTSSKDTHVTVEKITEIPELKLGQVWDSTDGKERFLVRTETPPNGLWFYCANNSAVLNPEVFFNLYPDAELILDA